MARQKRSSLKTIRQWEEFLNRELNISKSKSRRYAGVLVDEEYDEESIKFLLANSTPGVASSTLLKLGIKPGHCLLLAMHFGSHSTVASNTVSHNVEERFRSLLLNVVIQFKMLFILLPTETV